MSTIIIFKLDCKCTQTDVSNIYNVFCKSLLLILVLLWTWIVNQIPLFILNIVVQNIMKTVHLDNCIFKYYAQHSPREKPSSFWPAISDFWQAQQYNRRPNQMAINTSISVCCKEYNKVKILYQNAEGLSISLYIWQTWYHLKSALYVIYALVHYLTRSRFLMRQ